MTQEVYHSTSITYMGTKDLKTAGPCWNRILQISEAFCLSLTCCHRWKVCKDDMRVCRVARSYYWSQRVHHATFLNIVVNVVRQSFAWHMAQWLFTPFFAIPIWGSWHPPHCWIQGDSEHEPASRQDGDQPVPSPLCDTKCAALQYGGAQAPNTGG